MSLPDAIRTIAVAVCRFIVVLAVSWSGLFVNGSSAQSLRLFNNDAGLFDPAKGPVIVGYQLFSDAAQVEVRVVDFRGQVVTSYYYVDVRAGDHEFIWDGTNANGVRVADGRYQFMILVEFLDDAKDIAQVEVMVATLDSRPGVQLPEPLSPEDFLHRIYGSASTLYRFSEDLEDKNDGEMRLRTGMEYKDQNYTAKGVFQAVKPFDGTSAAFNGSQAMIEGRWRGGRAKGIIRDNLGNFNDPFQLFSDFKTERNKIGVVAEQNYGELMATGLVFTSEGDVDSEEQGAAGRLSFGDERSWLIGAGYTFRRALGSYYVEEKRVSQALAVDTRYQLYDALSILAEFVATEDELIGADYGVGIKGEYDLGALKFSAGYTSLGEKFKADFADPLHHVERDARGFDASLEYFMLQPLGIVSSFSATLRFFDLSRLSDDSRVQELDSSLRCGVGADDVVFLSYYNRTDEFGRNAQLLASINHTWNGSWSSRFQVNYADTDTSDSLRFSLNTNYKDLRYAGRLSIEWTRRTIDYSRFSPYDQGYIRFDVGSDRWHCQLQGKYTRNGEESGINMFGRVDYSPEFLHRYQVVSYVSIGNRSSLEFEEQYEIGIEVRF